VQRDVIQPRYGRPNDVLCRKHNIVDAETLSKFLAPVIGAIPRKASPSCSAGPRWQRKR